MAYLSINQELMPSSVFWERSGRKMIETNILNSSSIAFYDADRVHNTFLFSECGTNMKIHWMRCLLDHIKAGYHVVAFTTENIEGEIIASKLGGTRFRLYTHGECIKQVYGNTPLYVYDCAKNHHQHWETLGGLPDEYTVGQLGPKGCVMIDSGSALQKLMPIAVPMVRDWVKAGASYMIGFASSESPGDFDSLGGRVVNMRLSHARHHVLGPMA
jgi:hypothetical protein